MKKTILLPLAVLASLSLTNCASTSNAQRQAGNGALLGAAAGAIIGHQSGNTAKGAAAGAVIGGTVGHGVGSQQDKREGRY